MESAATSRSINPSSALAINEVIYLSDFNLFINHQFLLVLDNQQGEWQKGEFSNCSVDHLVAVGGVNRPVAGSNNASQVSSHHSRTARGPCLTSLSFDI